MYTRLPVYIYIIYVHCMYVCLFIYVLPSLSTRKWRSIISDHPPLWIRLQQSGIFVNISRWAVGKREVDTLLRSLFISWRYAPALHLPSLGATSSWIQAFVGSKLSCTLSLSPHIPPSTFFADLPFWSPTWSMLLSRWNSTKIRPSLYVFRHPIIEYDYAKENFLKKAQKENVCDAITETVK